MSRTQNTLTAMLGGLVALDAATALLMPHVTGAAKPPTGAVVATWFFAALTLAAAFGLRQNARWARPVIYVTCALRIGSGALGLGDNPGAGLVTLGVIGVVLSVIVIVTLVRTRRQSATAMAELA
jgi:hypothetical protein